MENGPIGVDPGSAGAWLDFAVLQSHPVKHQGGASVELKAKPIPADFATPELAAGPFVIEPGLAPNGSGFAVDCNVAAAVQTRDRIIMRRARSAGGFHTDAVFAVDNGRACEPQLKPDRAGAASRRDIPFFLARRGPAPIFNPCQPPAIVEARFAECAT